MGKSIKLPGHPLQRVRQHLWAGILLFGILSPIPLRSATFIVSNLNDFGVGSLRDAITSANATAGFDDIVFLTSGSILVNTPLPAITDPVFLNGALAPGYVPCGPPVIGIDGQGGGGNGIQLVAGASGSRIAAINVRNFQFNGIQLIGATNCQIAGCYVGTNLAGTAAAGNGQNGFQLEAGANNNKIGGSVACLGNVISGNGGSGISVVGGSNDTIVGNIVGLNAAGTAAIGNASFGIGVFGGGSSNIVGDGTALGRNVVSGNGTLLTGNGIDINGNTDSQISGNYIGLNAAGTAAIGNAENGLSLNNAQNCLVGGLGTDAGNVIADHNFHAIVLNGGSNNCSIFGNKCGTDAAGTTAFGNDDSGVIVINSSDVTIGGNTAAHRNILSGSLSEHGIFLINADNATVQGNFIGTDVTGTAPLPNADNGILILAGTVNGLIGGSGAGEANTIAFNVDDAVELISGADRQILISQNSIYCNGGVGINLNNAGNDNHPMPVILAASVTGANGTSQPNNFIELFFDTLCPPGGCQGRTHIATVTADAGGNWSYVGAIPPTALLSANARDVGPPATNAGNTSEFTCFTVLPVEGLTFSASLEDENDVLLDWSTTDAVQLSQFEVERSLDGQLFEQIGRVAASLPGDSYQFRDYAVEEGIQYYRLRVQDQDGHWDYSDVAAVQVGFSFVHVYPQPAQTHFFAQLSPESQGELIDELGRIVRSFGAAEAKQGVSVADLPDGMYYLRVRNATGSYRQKVLVVH